MEEIQFFGLIFIGYYHFWIRLAFATVALVFLELQDECGLQFYGNCLYLYTGVELVDQVNSWRFLRKVN